MRIVFVIEIERLTGERFALPAPMSVRLTMTIFKRFSMDTNTCRNARCMWK